MKKTLRTALVLVLVAALLSSLLSGLAAGGNQVTVYPSEDTTSFLRNPAMGWMLYVDASNGSQPYEVPFGSNSADEYWARQDANAQKASILYIRAPWSLFEPAEGQYAWLYDENYKKLISGALSRGLKLAFCVFTDAQDSYVQSTPDFVRQAGANGYYVDIGSRKPNTIETDASGSGYSPSLLNDGNEGSGWASAPGLTGPQYITIDYGATAQQANGITLVTHYGLGQGITNLDVQYWTGTAWATAVANQTLTWSKNTDAEESQFVAFPAVSSTEFRLKINSWNNAWGVFGLNEIYMSEPAVKQYWTPYNDDPVFRQKYENFLTAFAKEYDNPDKVDFIDANGLGWWGEVHHMFPDGYNGNVTETMAWITGAYKARFSHVLLNMMQSGQYPQDTFSNAQVELGNFSGMRRCSAGSPVYMSQSVKDELISQFNQGIPIFAENVYHHFVDWCTPWAADYPTLNDALTHVVADAEQVHANTLDLRVPADATEWTTNHPALVNEFALNGGYRLVPVSVQYPGTVQAGSNVSITQVWKNTGVGRMPNNRVGWDYKYKVAYALLNPVTGEPVSVSLTPAAEPSAWVKGANYSYSSSLSVGQVADGTYDLAVAIVDTTKGNAPAINLAVTNAKTPLGWYKLGSIAVSNSIGNCAETASASTTAGTNSGSIAAVVDGDDNSAWASAAGVTFPQYITLDWGSNSLVQTSELTLAAYYGQGQGITNLDVEYWNGSAWATAASNVPVSWSSNTAAVEYRDVSFPEITASALRIKVNSANTTWSLFALNELRVSGTYLGNKALAAVVSVSAPSDGSLASYINDGNDLSCWGSAAGITFPQYITFDFGGQAVTTSMATLVTHYGQGQGITSFNIEYWNGAVWVTAASNLSISWSQNSDTEEYRNVSFSPITATKIRIEVTGANMTWQKFAINEVKFW